MVRQVDNKEDELDGEFHRVPLSTQQKEKHCLSLNYGEYYKNTSDRPHPPIT